MYLYAVGLKKRSRVENTENRYNKLAREIREVARRIRDLYENEFRNQSTMALLDKLYNLGLVPHKGSLEVADKITASSFCRRRLSMFMLRSKMAPHLNAAIKFITHGHVRVGINCVRDPAFLVTRTHEDYITWTDRSKIKEAITHYHGDSVEDN